MDGIIFMIASHIQFQEGETAEMKFKIQDDASEQAFVESRKELHLRMNDKYLCNLPLALIFNYFESSKIKSESDDYQLKYLEELVRFNDIPTPLKKSFLLNASNASNDEYKKFNAVWQWLGKTITNEKQKQKKK